ncbi:hypothetical protein F0562_026815 [Nyssa sinensis]|uniref:NPH3 domain-containing protein n=1 Tax=Nyssa sinensis TaxID=561372 RepID=A0A5J5BAE8_9ASTE|nr:hypothetical protein F0562_026815 [Nyssa sinensis]
MIPVAANDIAFSIHAVLLTAFTLFQITIYDRGNQKSPVLTRCRYPAINKPAAVLHWLNHADIDAEFIVILDADMIMRGPITPWEYKAARGRPVSTPYDYLIGCENELAKLHTRHPEVCDKVGGVIIMHIDDLRKFALLWLHKTEEVRADTAHYAKNFTGDIYESRWISEMYGYSFGAAETHPDLNKSERRHLCRILDCKKFSVEACMHAAQNELLPLRVVVQVLFFGQARVAMAGGQVTELPNNIKTLLATHDDPSKPSTHTTVPAEDQWSVSRLKSPKSKLSTLRMKLAEDNDLDENFKDGIGKSSKVKAICALPTRLKGMFSNLWSINRSASEKN